MTTAREGAAAAGLCCAGFWSAARRGSGTSARAGAAAWTSVRGWATGGATSTDLFERATRVESSFRALIWSDTTRRISPVAF